MLGPEASPSASPLPPEKRGLFSGFKEVGMRLVNAVRCLLEQKGQVESVAPPSITRQPVSSPELWNNAQKLLDTARKREDGGGDKQS